MRKEYIIFLLVLLKVCYAQQSFAYQESDILFCNLETSILIQKDKHGLATDLTISGYLWFDHLPQQDIELIQFNSIFKNQEEVLQDPLYPKCLLDQNALENNSDIREYSFIKNNPNCNIKKQIKEDYLQMKLTKNEQFYKIQIRQKDELIYESDGFNVLRQKFIFFALSINIDLQTVNLLLYNIQEDFKVQKNDLKILDLNEKILQLEIQFAQNENYNFNGGIKKFNIFNVFTESLENLMHIDQSVQNQIRDNINLELNGTLMENGDIKQTHHLLNKVQMKGDNIISESTYLQLKDNQYLQWNDLIEEITTKIFILKTVFQENIQNINILKIEQDNLNVKIYLKKLIFEEDKELIPPNIYHLEFEIQNNQFLKKTQLSQIELNKQDLMFGFTQVQNQIQFFYINELLQFKQLKFLDFPIKNFRPVSYSLFENDKNYTQFQRLLILNSLTPFVFKDLTKIEDCILPVMPTYDNEKCLICQNSVLSYDRDYCYNYCPVNFKNIGGLCLPCTEKNCKEIDPTHLQVERVGNTQFEINLSHSLPSLNYSNFDKIIKISQNKDLLQNEKDYDIDMITDKKLIVQLKNNKTIYEDDLNIQLNFSNAENQYDENNNYVQQTSIVYKASVIRHLSKQQKVAIKICAIIMLGIFLITVIIGTAIVVLGCKNNVNELIAKKIILLIQQLQFLPFLLLFRIDLPSNLHYFLKLLFEYFIQYNEILGFLKNQSPYIFTWNNPHPNFCDRQFSANYLYNFGVIFIIHFILLTIYALAKFYQKKGQRLSYKRREQVKKLVDIFEFNLLLLMFWLFSNQIVIFSTLSIENSSAQNWVQLLSIFVSYFYVFIIIGFLIVFASLYMKKNGFLNNQNLKYKMSFLFIGQKNKKIANAFEVIKLTLQIGFCVCLTYFRNNTFAQLTTTLFFCFAGFILLVVIRPFEKRRANFLQIINQGILVLAILLLYMLAVRDRLNNYDINLRDKLGWIIITLLCVSQVQSFYITMKELMIFWNKISCSSKLIFYQKEEYFKNEFSPANQNKFISEEKLNFSGMKKSSKDGSSASNYGNLGNLTRFGKNLKQNLCNSLKKKQRQEYVQVDISATDSLEYSSKDSDQMEHQHDREIFNRF